MKKSGKKSTYKMLAAAVAIAGVSAGALGANAVFAAESTERPGMEMIVEKIATKFNLDSEDVRIAFEEHRAEMEEEMQAREAERLAQAVESGELTQAQVEAILVKRDELRLRMEEARENFEPGTEIDRETVKEQMRAEMEDLQAWADEQGIDLKYLHPFGHRIGEGHEGRMGHGKFIKRIN